MTNRVNVNITARDLTRAQLDRLRHNFSRLGSDLDRAVGERTRANFTRLSRAASQARRDLNAMRGAIPDDEFVRLDTALQRAQRRLARGFGNVGRRAFGRIADDLRQVSDGFRDLDRNSQIRIRIDTSALRRADARLNAWRTMQGRNAVRIPVRPDVDRNRMRGALRTLASPLFTAGRILGGTLSDGIGQGVANGFRGLGPIMAVALSAAIAGSLSVVGAALSGLLITVLGAAFVSIGGISAAMSDEVKKKWSDVLKSLKKDFEDVGKPMIPVLERALGNLEKMANEAAPKLKQAIEDTVPATNKFIDGLIKGFESFGKAAFQPIMDAWNVFAPVFGEQWDEFMRELGDSFAEMADLVKEHPTEIASALEVVFEVLELLIDAVTFFGEAWVTLRQTVGDVIGGLVQGLQVMVNFILGAFEGIIDGAAQAFGWVPGLGPKLRDASKNFDNFRQTTTDILTNLANKAYGWDDALNKANRKRKLDADIRTWQHKLELAKAKLKSVPEKKKAKVAAEVAEAMRRLAALRARLAAIKSKTVNVHTTYTSTSVGGHPTQRRRAMGGVIGAAATGGVRSNMTLVGEAGPEIVDLPPGARVRSNPDTRRIMAQESAGGGSTLVLKSSGRRVDDLLLEILREAIHQRGGDPVTVLGG